MSTASKRETSAMALILIIEDDEQTRTLLRMMMEREGYEVVEAADGKQALELFHERNFDLVITDILMPVRDGIETIRDLRRDSPEVKIIAISGGGRDGALDFLPVAEQLGADRTFQKPTRRAELVSAVKEILESAQAR